MKLPRITLIEIEENGARSSTVDQNTDGSQFKLTVSNVRHFFTKGLQVKNTFVKTPNTAKRRVSSMAWWGLLANQHHGIILSPPISIFNRHDQNILFVTD